MSKKYTAEFREEAVKQVEDRGYSVADATARLDVSAQSLQGNGCIPRYILPLSGACRRWPHRPSD